MSSNLERLLWYVTDEKKVRQLMDSLNSEGRYEIPREIFWIIAEHFYGCFADEKDSGKENHDSKARREEDRSCVQEDYVCEKDDGKKTGG